MMHATCDIKKRVKGLNMYHGRGHYREHSHRRTTLYVILWAKQREKTFLEDRRTSISHLNLEYRGTTLMGQGNMCATTAITGRNGQYKTSRSEE